MSIDRNILLSLATKRVPEWNRDALIAVRMLLEELGSQANDKEKELLLAVRTEMLERDMELFFSQSSSLVNKVN